ncbi:MAG: ATP-binding protein [Alphaproteobacteria bacterium]|nr:ATP-binding protein [Alphaproteobacteria bacterium]
MSNLVRWIAETIREHVVERRYGGNASAESRWIFHGPPLEILSLVYEELAGSVGIQLEGLPVLLQVPSLGLSEPNPAIGLSGRCDEAHLLDMRNSPSAPSYLALVPPGHHAIRSVSSTTDQFGVAATSNGTNASFDEWIADPFIQRVLEAAVDATATRYGDDARELLRKSLEAIDDVDKEKATRSGSWRLVSRMFEVSAERGNVDRQISLACGVPPMEENKLSAKEQLAIVQGVAEALSSGFATGLSDARAKATTEQQDWIDACLDHVRMTCEVLTALDRAPQAYYAPSLTAALVDPPAWWSGLTVEVWEALLDDEPEFLGDIQIECRGGEPELPPSKGVPLIVTGKVDLVIRGAAEDGGSLDVTLERSIQKNKNGFPARVAVDGQADFPDDCPPEHKSPISYKASAIGCRPASVKVISLATWLPGIFVGCRHARKVTPPKAPSRRTKGPNLETSLNLPGPGRFELLVYLRPGVSIADKAWGSASSDTGGVEELDELAVREVRQDVYQFEVEADGSYQVDIVFDRPDKGGRATSETCRVFLVCEDVAEDGCRSEFERLIKLNRRSIEGASKPLVVLNRSARCSSLQGWMLQEHQAGCSYLPLVLAEDYAEYWVQPEWSEEKGRIISGGKFLVDPRPPASSFIPPQGFVDARKRIAELVRSADEQTGLVEAAKLGDWLSNNAEYQGTIEQYLDTYTAWLRASPEIASWVDVIAVNSLEQGGRTLSRSPEAILLSPLHPLRLAWHSVAQRMLYESATGDRPCPAGGVVDPRVVPDFMQLPVVSPEGVQRVSFLSVESNSDYWSVLWNGDRLRDLGKRSLLSPFGPELGITVGGISTGFSANQVRRALNDVSNVLCAKPTISVVVSSAGGMTDSCNEGLMDWSEEQYVEPERLGRRQSPGPRRLDVYDSRDKALQPDEATVGNLSDDTRNNVRWFTKVPDGVGLDLGVIAQLDSSEPEISDSGMRSPLGAGGLLRHRVRKQLPNYFLSESRQGRAGAVSGDALGDKVSACMLLLESSGDRSMGLRFAPNVHAISEMLEERKTDFVAISSSSVDPACFLGGWLEDSYLWDYDLPSYSQRAGDTNGYYVLSKVKASDREGMRKVLKRLPGCADLDDAKIRDILLEIARRGIPTIRGLSGDDTGSTGDLGLFVASRLLQDRFRIGGGVNSLLPVLGGEGTRKEIVLVVPVDPFRGYLEDLSRSLHENKVDLTLSRPDLVVVGITLDQARVRIHITPVEVKSRLSSVFPNGDVEDALSQAKALANLLRRMSAEKGPLSAWRLAYQHLLLTIIGFGMRVYSQHQDLGGQLGEWAEFHERIATAIFEDADCVSIDRRGRLIVIDGSPLSEPRDCDLDGFEETIVISLEDSGRIVAKDAAAFYDKVRSKVGDWQLKPAGWSGADEGPKPGTDGNDVGPIVPSKPASGGAQNAPQPVLTPQPPIASGRDLKGDASPQPLPSPGNGIRLAVGRSERSFEAREFSLAISDTRLNQLNMGVVGDLGTGKTQLLKSIVHQIVSSANDNRGIRPRVMIFDYKRDYSTQDFVQATGARVVRPHRLPLNLFDTRNMEDTTVPWLDRFRFFADVLEKIYAGIGPVQRDKLKRAVRTAYDATSGQRAPTIYDVHAAYSDLLDGKSDSPMAIIDDLVDMEIFERDPGKTVAFDQFLDGVVVISLDALGQDDRSKNMLVAVMLNMFYENMLRLPKRPFLGESPQLRAVDSYLLVDEADNIMRYEFDVLRKLLLQGREFGCGVILASQYLRHFKVNATDYREPLLTWFVHKVPNVMPAELAALGLSGTAAEMAERVKQLPNHHCLFKSFDSPGQVIRGLPFYEMIARPKRE